MRGSEPMLDRAKYLALVLVLYAAGVAALVGVVARLFERPFLEVTVNLAPAIVLCLIGVVVHGLRHDLDS
ncbi:MAG: hypothetical protein ACTHWF_13045 [Brachybacterium sp.]